MSPRQATVSKLSMHGLVFRFAALGILIVCLSALSPSRNSLSSPGKEIPLGLQTQSGQPTVLAKKQADAPLVISSQRVISWDGQDLEVALDVVNVGTKAIRGYALGFSSAQGGEAPPGQILFVNLDLSSNSSLTPNRITTIFDVQHVGSTKEPMEYFVDYVEFSDGSKWGSDSGNNRQRAAGQRAAAQILSERLLAILNTGGSGEVMTAIEKGVADIEPPSEYSQEWKEGFRLACNSISQRLKMLQNRKGSPFVDSELRQLAQRFQREH